MRYIYLVFIAGVIYSCNSSENLNSKSEEVEAETPTTTLASSFKTEDTIFIEALGDNMSDIRYNKDSIEVTANKEVTIALINKSTDASMPHNIVVITKNSANSVGQNGVQFKENGYVNPEDNNVIVHSPIAQINETIYISFKAPPAGRYEFICSFPGHWAQMKGDFISI